MSKREWSTHDLTADLVGRFLADQHLAVAEVTLPNGQRADVLVMKRSFTPRPMLILEVKTSRADLLGDLRRDKWRGYLAHGVVAFAFPQGLADPKEIPAEAGVYVRIPQGWSWRRAPRYQGAPQPTDYLFRRMALSANDQAAARVEAKYTPRRADVYRVAARARTEVARQVGRVAADLETWQQILEDKQKEWEQVRGFVAEIEQREIDVSRRERALPRLEAAE